MFPMLVELSVLTLLMKFQILSPLVLLLQKIRLLVEFPVKVPIRIMIMGGYIIIPRLPFNQLITLTQLDRLLVSKPMEITRD